MANIDMIVEKYLIDINQTSNADIKTCINQYEIVRL